jgi:hypothetical protein
VQFKKARGLTDVIVLGKEKDVKFLIGLFCGSRILKAVTPSKRVNESTAAALVGSNASVVPSVVGLTIRW